MVLKTLALSFEDVQLWISNPGDLLLIASNRPIKVDPMRIEQAMNSRKDTQKDFSEYLLAQRSSEILGRLFLDKPGILAFSQGALVNSDNYPYLEFLAPKNLYQSEQELILRKLSDWSGQREPEPLQKATDSKGLADIFLHRSEIFSRAGWLGIAEEYLDKALAMDETREDFYFQRGKIFSKAKKYRRNDLGPVAAFKTSTEE